ncbi:MAG: DUF3710 domain-containing protein [Tetrasphaera sp.]
MSLFRRRAAAPLSEPDPTDNTDTDQGEQQPTTVEEAGPTPRPTGPFDADEVDGRGDRFDLGALWVAPYPDLEVRVEIDQQADALTGLQLLVGDSTAQVQAFAAPRSGGLWAEIREELAASITSAGGSAEESTGEYGTELTVNLPQQGPDGQTVFAPARFLGIDGPRWFLRIVLSGRAAAEPDAPSPILEAVRGLVVVRGDTPMAPRELLPLRLPEPEDTAPAEPEPPQQPDLNPFERGPEITEVR